MTTPVWEQDMNPEQLEAIRHDRGPLRLLASAGSGKTRALVHRIARLVHQGVKGHRILAVTFSKDASVVMNTRLTALGIENAAVSTWHALCLKIIKDDKVRGHDWEFGTGADAAAEIQLKQVVGYQGLNWPCDLGQLKRFIGLCMAAMVKPGEEQALALARRSGYKDHDVVRAGQAYELYLDAVATAKILTFDHMLVLATSYLLEDESARRSWASRYDYVLQDEAQDCSFVQCRLATVLSQDHKNYTVVGDVFQTLYTWRGADHRSLINFEREWPGAKSIWMGRNYRSGSTIINAANALIQESKLPGITPQPMICTRGVTGSVAVVSAATVEDEAEEFALWARGLIETGTKPSDIACLYRINSRSRAVEEALLQRKLPYVVRKGISFYERKEVKDLLAYLRIGTGSARKDDLRCLNAPFRFLGKAFVARVREAVDDEPVSTWPVIIRGVAQEPGTQGRQRQSVLEWCSLIEHVGQVQTQPANVALQYLVDRTRYLDWIVKNSGEDSIEASGVANVRELLRVSAKFASPASLLGYVAQTIEDAEDQGLGDRKSVGERIVLSSIHSAKGMEHDNVWVISCNDGVLPHMRAEVEEERMVMYVAMTRAKDTLVLSYVTRHATSRGVLDAHPSPFLYDAGLLSDDNAAAGVQGEQLV